MRLAFEDRADVDTAAVATPSSAFGVDAIDPGGPVTVYTTSQTPSPLPSSANPPQDSRPEINGSFGAFIAVVVVLSLFILGASAGIFFLLRNHEPTAHERRTRRARAGPSANRAFVHDAPLGPAGMRERFAGLFTWRRGGRRGGGGGGWIKAAGEDGDEWDARDDAFDPHVRFGGTAESPYYSRRPSRGDSGETGSPQLSERERGDSDGGLPASFGRRPGPIAPATSTDSVEVELRVPSAGYVTPSLGSAYATAGADFLPGRLSDPSIDGARGEVSTPSGSPLRESPTAMESAAGEDASPHSEDDGADERKFSVQSASSTGGISLRSMRKFDNGTKFREGLNF